MWLVQRRCGFDDGQATPAAVLQWAAREHGRRPALKTAAGDVTYGDLADLVRSLAAGLARVGVRPGDRVAASIGNTLDWITLSYASSWLGAVMVPLHLRYTSAEMLDAVIRSRPMMMVCAPTYQGRDRWPMLREVWEKARLVPATRELRLVTTEPAGAGVDTLDRLHRAGTGPEEVRSDTAMIMYTSGSTRKPKGVVLRSGAIVRNAYNVGQRMGCNQSDVLFSPMPFYHAGGAILSVLTAATHGLALVTMDVFDPEQAVELIARHRCTVHIGMDVMFLKESLADNFSLERISSLRTGWIAGAGDSPMKVYRSMQFPFVSLFGMTELSGNACMTRLDDDAERRLSWAGEPQPGVEIGIFGGPRRDERLPPGETGEIRIRGWNVMAGYWEEPAETARVVDAQGWLHSGDLGYVDEVGYLRFTGRSKEVLKIGGENVSVGEVEAVMSSHEAVAMAVLVGIPDDVYGEKAVAFVQRNRGADLDEAELIAFCRQRLAAFKSPRHVVFMTSGDWPVLGPEKIHRQALVQIAAEALASDPRPPR